MSDLFHPKVPDEYIVKVARVMKAANWHTYQVLTKRADRMSALLKGKLRFAAEQAHNCVTTTIQAGAFSGVTLPNDTTPQDFGIDLNAMPNP